MGRNIAELESGTLPPLTTAVELARLTNRACIAFRQQTGEEQRKLITLVMKEASWQEKKLSATLFEPFSLVRRSNQLKASNFNDLGAREESFEDWLAVWQWDEILLGFQDEAYRRLFHLLAMLGRRALSVCVGRLVIDPDVGNER